MEAMMEIDTCKFYNGTYHNTHCKAGVAYRDVTTDPDDINGIAFRSPCIDWEMYNALKKRKWDNDSQKENYARRGYCDKREAPTVEEVEEFEAKMEAKFKETMDNIKNDICPNHKTPMTKKQVGRCVYAEPCGCRLYQGKV